MSSTEAGGHDSSEGEEFMVKVPKGYRSKNVRDRRTSGGSGGGGRGFGFPRRSSSSGGGGLGGTMGGGALGGATAPGGQRRGCGGGMGIILLLVLAFVVFSCVSGGGGGGNTTSTGSTSSGDGGFVAPNDPAYAAAEDLVNFVLDDVQDFWAAEFAASGQQYPFATLTIFNDGVSTGGCGNASSAVGPFYCPADNNAYIDIQYMLRLQDQLGAEGDFSQAYILAHEIGHHVQNVLGTNDQVRRAQSGASRTQSNALQVAMELQADCLAGMWARSAQDSGLLDAGDLQEGVRAASAVGDDAITGSSNQENFTHGSSAQRVEWFQRGFEEQSYDACDTF